MHVLITGGGGFIGNQLARELFRRRRLKTGSGEKIGSLTLADLSFSPAASAGFDGSVACVAGDISSQDFIRPLIRRDTAAVFHLAAMVSGEGERNFDGCLRVNLDGTRHLLEACRAMETRPRAVFASSLAVFGGHSMTEVVSDSTKPIPQTTYGMTKLIGELLINDYSRKGFLDGRAARLPTVFIRPGKPNAAASSFASGLFREPLNGETCELPVERSLWVPLLGYRRVVANLIRLMECDAALLGDDRTVSFPSTRYRISDMIATLQAVAKEKGIRLGAIVDTPDPVIIRIVHGWPVATDAKRVPALGLESDTGADQVIREYIEDFLPVSRRAG